MKKVLVLFFCLLASWNMRSQTAADSLKFSEFIAFANKKHLAESPVGDMVYKVGEFFLNTPYVGATLEVSVNERLQCNLMQFDCNTFVENVLALSVLLQQEDGLNWFYYKRILENIRYQGGVINGYQSRLHYASDWLTDNVSKIIFKWVSEPTLEKAFKPNVSYMSTHPNAYPALSRAPELIPEIVNRETYINTLNLKYIPKAHITANAPWIQTGDVVAITTNVAGLDFSHMGIAVRKNGKVYLMHASSTLKKVVVSKETLKEYLAGIKKHTGVVVVRLL